MLSVLGYFLVLVTLSVTLFNGSLIVVGQEIKTQRELLNTRKLNFSTNQVIMDPMSDEVLSGGQDVLTIDSSVVDGQNVDLIYLSPRLNSTYSHSPNTNAEFTQMVSIMAFFTIVILAIIAWILSRQCSLRAKSSRGSVTSSDIAAHATASRLSHNNQQFNFLGVQVLRRISTTPAVSVDKPDDLPPCYEELFPPPHTVVTCPPLPAYTMDDVIITVTNSGHASDNVK